MKNILRLRGRKKTKNVITSMSDNILDRAGLNIGDYVKITLSNNKVILKKQDNPEHVAKIRAAWSKKSASGEVISHGKIIEIPAIILERAGINREGFVTFTIRKDGAIEIYKL